VALAPGARHCDDLVFPVLSVLMALLGGAFVLLLWPSPLLLWLTICGAGYFYIKLVAANGNAPLLPSTFVDTTGDAFLFFACAFVLYFIGNRCMGMYDRMRKLCIHFWSGLAHASRCGASYTLTFPFLTRRRPSRSRARLGAAAARRRPQQPQEQHTHCCWPCRRCFASLSPAPGRR
jgi:hypothetical protein